MTRGRRALLAGLLLAATVGCGGEQGAAEDYCARLTEQRQQLAEMVASSDPDALLDNLGTLEDLGERAPRDLRGEWDTLLAALRGLDEALRGSGRDAADFAEGVPEDLSVEARAQLEGAVARLESADVVEATTGIETQARDVCKVNLGL